MLILFFSLFSLWCVCLRSLGQVSDYVDLCGADVENLVHIFRELCGRLGHFFDICYFLLDVA